MPPKFAINKGIIFDSAGNRSKECDIVIYERDFAAAAFNFADRHLIPVESVYGIIEIKSILNKKAYQDAIQTFVSTDTLSRRFSSVGNLSLDDEQRSRLEAGIGVQDAFISVGVIWSAIIAFNAPTPKTICKYLETHAEGMWAIVIPGREFIYKSPEGFTGIKSVGDSISLFLIGVLDLLNDNKRSLFYRPDFRIYRSNVFKTVIEQLGDNGAWHCKRSDSAEIS